MKPITTLIAVLLVAILNAAMVISAPVQNANSITSPIIVKPDNPSIDPFFGDNAPASAKVVEKADEFKDCASPCDFYVHRSVDTNAMADVYATPGAIDGQVPGVVPLGKRDAVLVEKSDTIEECTAPYDFYIRSVATEDPSSPAYKKPGSGFPILPRKVAPVGYHTFVDDEAPKYKRDIEGASADETSFPWPPGFKGPRSKREEGNADCEPINPVSPTTVIVQACDTSKRSEAKVPLDPASGGYASGAPKPSEQVTR